MEHSAHRLTRTQLAKRLNECPFALLRRQAGGKKTVITTTGIGKWINEQGCPVNPDGKTLDIVSVCAWLAIRYQEGGTGGAAPTGDPQALADQMRQHVDAGDIVGLISCLMGWVGDIEMAKAVSQIVVNVINAEKGRVKAQADEYERRIRAGELLEAKDVEQGRLERARYIRETLEGLGAYAPRLQGRTLVEIREELNAIGRELLLRLASEGTEGLRD